MSEVLGNINIIFYILAFIVGGIPFGYVIVKLTTGLSLLKFGSGGTGATNVYRILKEKKPNIAKLGAIATILLDATKGLVVILIMKLLGISYEAQWSVALLCVIGHCYSPFLGFNGGKGVATAIGSVFLLIPVEGAIGLLAWIIMGKKSKISSLSSVSGVIVALLASYITPNFLPNSINIISQIDTRTPLVLICIFILYTHFDNITRLIKGEENKVL